MTEQLKINAIENLNVARVQNGWVITATPEMHMMGERWVATNSTELKELIGRLCAPEQQ